MIKFRAWFEESVLKKAHMVDWEELKEFKGLSRLFDDAPHSETFSLMQSTGLKDKNGVEIYVGDIVKGEQWLTTTMPAWIVDQVSYSERSTMFYLGSANEIHNRFMHSLGNTIYQYEVIGNIYANPELISQGIE